MKNNKIRWIVFFVFSLLSFCGYTTNIENTQSELDRVLTIHYFKDIAIIDVDTNSYNNTGRMAKKIIIRKLVQPNYSTDQKPPIKLLSLKPQLGEIIWTITPEELPVSESTCLNANIDPCEYDPKNFSPLSGCYHSCVQYGPEFLAYDQKREKLYFLADTINVGQGGGPFLGFVADIKTKKIKYLKVFGGFAEGELSPSAKYLLIKGNSFITIYNTENGDDSSIVEKNSWNPPHEKLHYMGHIHWLSDTQFSYQDGVKHSKFQPSFDEKKENVYDISFKKIIYTRTMAKTEYDSKPYVEKN